MASSKAARDYLRDALPPGEMGPASRAFGLNHAYLQQYITRGKPAWLKEQLRDFLVQAYGLDPEKLKPDPKPLKPIPSKRSGRDGGDKSKINPPRDGKFVDDPRTIELLDVWGRITREDRRELALRILRSMADEAGSIVA